MLKRLSLLIISGLILTTSTLVNANPAENKLSLSIFSELKQKRSSFPTKSKFETNEEYQRKVNAVSVSARPLRLELPLSSGEYNPQTRQLSVKLNTSYTSISSSAMKDKELAEGELFESDFIELLNYRTDSQTISQDVITCVNGFGARYEYLHTTKKSNNYLVNALGIDEDEKIILNLSPQEARRYFKPDETSLNDRLKVRINIDPIAPFYTSYSSYSGNECPQSELQRSFANLFGTTTNYKNNHLIHADVSYLEIFDKVTGKTLYSITPNRETETRLSDNPKLDYESLIQF